MLVKIYKAGLHVRVSNKPLKIRGFGDKDDDVPKYLNKKDANTGYPSAQR